MNYTHTEAVIATDQVLLYKLLCRQVARAHCYTASTLCIVWGTTALPGATARASDWYTLVPPLCGASAASAHVGGHTASTLANDRVGCGLGPGRGRGLAPVSQVRRYFCETCGKTVGADSGRSPFREEPEQSGRGWAGRCGCGGMMLDLSYLEARTYRASAAGFESDRLAVGCIRCSAGTAAANRRSLPQPVHPLVSQPGLREP